MISQTCLTPPTGVPVEVMTHWAWLVGPPLGADSVLPAGHDVVPYPAGVGAGDAPTALEMLAPDRASRPTAADNITPVRTRSSRGLLELRTSPPHDASRSTRK